MSNKYKQRYKTKTTTDMMKNLFMVVATIGLITACFILTLQELLK